MKVTITTLTGEKHELEVGEQDTVKQLKVGDLVLSKNKAHFSLAHLSIHCKEYIFL